MTAALLTPPEFSTMQSAAHAQLQLRGLLPITPHMLHPEFCVSRGPARLASRGLVYPAPSTISHL